MLSGCEQASRYASPKRGTAMWIGNEARVVGQGGKLTIYLGFFNIDCFGCYNIHNTKVTFITATQGGTS